MQTEFAEPHNKWHACAPRDLLREDVSRVEWSVADDKLPLKRQLEAEARNADWLVLWLDCDREGEAIAYVCRADLPSMDRGDAAAGDVDVSLVNCGDAAAATWDDSVETNRGAAAAATWIFRGDASRLGRGRDVDIPWRRGRRGRGVDSPRRRVTPWRRRGHLRGGEHIVGTRSSTSAARRSPTSIYGEPSSRPSTTRRWSAPGARS